MLGQTFLRGLADDLGLPLVSANVVYAAAPKPAPGQAPQRKPFFAPWRTVTIGRGRFCGVPYGGVKVGIFGLVDAHSRLQHRDPTHGTDPNPVTWEPPEVAAKRVVAQMQAEGCDLIIGVTQLHLARAEALGRSIPGIHLLLAGAEQRFLATHRQAGDTVVVATDYEGRSLGEVVLRWKGRGQRVEVVRFQQNRLDEAYADDPGQRGIIQGFHDKLRERKLAPDVTLPTEGRFVGSDACMGCHAEEYAHWQHDAKDPNERFTHQVADPAEGNATAHGSKANFQKHIVDQGEHWNPACLRCHVIGYAFAGGFRSVKETPDRVGVGCESCHGPRSAHLAWQRWRAGHRDPGVTEAPPDPGRGRDVRRSTCISCHDRENSPRFNAATGYWTYYSRIEHPSVRRAREKEKEKPAPPPPIKKPKDKGKKKPDDGDDKEEKGG